MSLAVIVVLLAVADSHALSGDSRGEMMPSAVDDISFGVIGGINGSDIRYSDKNNDEYSSEAYTRPVFGVYGEYMITRRWGVRPEFVYVGKGQEIDDDGFQYDITLDGVDIRLPVTFDVLKAGAASVYLQAGGYMGIPFGGSISYSDDAHDRQTRDIDAAISPAEFGLLIGAGARHRFHIANAEIRYGLDVTYNSGSTDNNSSKELSEAGNALSASNHKIYAARTHQGVMVRGLVGIPFGTVYRAFCSDCDPDVAFGDAMRLYKGRQYLEASYEFGRVAVKWPTFRKNDSAILYKGRSLEKLHLHEAARKAYESGLSNHGSSPLAARFHFQLLNIAYKDTAWAEARRNYDAVQRLSQAHPDVSVQMDAAYVMGQAFFAQGRFALARDWLEFVREGDPNHPYAQFTLGLILAREDRLAEARQAFESIVAKQPVNKSEAQLQEGARMMLGHVLHSQPEPQLARAVQLYAQVPPGSVNYEEAQLATAWCFVRNAVGKPQFWADVRRHVANVSRQSPLYPERLLVEGYSHLSRGQCDSASTSFQAILDIAGKDSISPEAIRRHDAEHASLVAMQRDVSDKVYQLTLQLPSERVLEERQAIRDRIGRIAKGADDQARFHDLLARHDKFRSARVQIAKDATYGLASSKKCQDRSHTESGGF